MQDHRAARQGCIRIGPVHQRDAAFPQRNRRPTLIVSLRRRNIHRLPAEGRPSAHGDLIRQAHIQRLREALSNRDKDLSTRDSTLDSLISENEEIRAYNAGWQREYTRLAARFLPFFESNDGMSRFTVIEMVDAEIGRVLAPGGCVALVRALTQIDELTGDNHDQDVGISIARRAMEEPLRQIVINCGEEGSVVLNKVAAGEGNYGYNAASGEYGDMVEMGILDPTKVTRSALQNAASVAGLIITTEAMVAERPKEEGAAPGGGMPDMGGMM